MWFLHKLERGLPEQSITVIKWGLIGQTRLLTHVILFAVSFRSLSTDIVACKFVTGIGLFGGVYCD